MQAFLELGDMLLNTDAGSALDTLKTVNGFLPIFTYRVDLLLHFVI